MLSIIWRMEDDSEVRRPQLVRAAKVLPIGGRSAVLSLLHHPVRELPWQQMSGRMLVTIVDGNLLDQEVDTIVNAWNRNIIPWWLLLPQGVSGAIKKRAGLQPFLELGRMGAIPLGHAVETTPGKLPFRSIIHVAGINMLWRSTERSIRDSVRNAVAIAHNRGYRSMALPLIGAGSGGGKPEDVQRIIESELTKCQFHGEVRIVRYLEVPPNRA